MKRIRPSLLAVVLCLSLSLPASAAAAETVAVSEYPGRIMIDGTMANNQISEKEEKSALEYNGTKYVSSMAAGQWLGADVAWDETAGAVTVTHNGKAPYFPTWSELSAQGVEAGYWNLDTSGGREARLLDSRIVVDGVQRGFFNRRGEAVRPIRFRGYLFLPLEAVSELMGKQMTEVSIGFSKNVYLYNAPTREELNEAGAYLATVRGHLDAVRAVVKGAAPKTREEYVEKVRQMQEHLKAVWTLPQPAFDSMRPFVELLREQAELTLWQNIDTHLPQEENSGAQPYGELDPTHPTTRPTSHIQLTGPNGETWDGPTWEEFWAEINLDPARWKAYAQSIVTEEENTSTNFMGLENTCANGERFLAEIAYSSAATAAAFTDAADIQNWEAVAALRELGIISGKPDGSFDPTATVTRAEAARLMSALIGEGETSEAPVEFSDTKGHWAKPYIDVCVRAGVLSGRGDGAFAPDDSVTALELAKMALTALGYDPAAYGLVGPNWAENTEALLRSTEGRRLDAGLEGLPLNAPISRDDTAQLVYNALLAVPRTLSQAANEKGEAYVPLTGSDGAPVTLLHARFGRDAMPALPAQPTA